MLFMKPLVGRQGMSLAQSPNIELKHDRVPRCIFWLLMEVVMEPLKSMGLLILVVSCQGVTSGFAMEAERPAQPPEVRKELHTTSPTPTSRYMNVEGRLKEIQGDMYILEGSSADQPIQVKVGKDTAFPNGKKEPGQPIQALVSVQDGHALIIR